jgi:hypothetical protein
LKKSSLFLIKPGEEIRSLRKFDDGKGARAAAF